jgi:hypothetical protein
MHLFLFIFYFLFFGDCSAFEGKAFRYVGPEADGKNLFKLISQHKGKRGTGDKFDVVIAMNGVTEEKSKLVQKALEKDVSFGQCRYSDAAFLWTSL